MNKLTILISLLFSLAGMSATTRPAEDHAPNLSLFIQGQPPEYGKPLSLVFQVSNQSQTNIEIDNRVGCARAFSDSSEEENKVIGVANELWFDEGKRYMVRFHLSTPLPREKEGFLVVPDLHLKALSVPIEVAPGESYFYRIDLPAELRLQGTSEIYFSLIQNKREAVRSETAKIEIAK